MSAVLKCFIIFSLGITMLFLLTALVVDVGYMYHQKARLQTVADMAALSALGSFDASQPLATQQSAINASVNTVIISNYGTAPDRPTFTTTFTTTVTSPGGPTEVDKVTLDIIRYGQRLRKTVELGEFESAAPRAANRPVRARSEELLGFSAMQITPQLAQRMGVSANTTGVIVHEIDAFSPAAGYLVPGTQIISINGREVRTVQDVERVAESLRPGQVVSLVVRSGDTEEQVVARCGEPGRRDSAHETLWLPGGQQRVRVERWHYKLGTRQLERVILLYQGRVVAVQSGAR